MSTVRSRALSRSQPVASRIGAFTVPRSSPSWQVNSNGHITNFDMKLLRKDILQRLADDRLYTLQECRVFLIELTRVAAEWQEEELPYLMYLSDLHERLLPGVSFSFQWPTSSAESVPLGDVVGVEGTIPILSKVVEETNRSVARMIDRLWESRRQRLLFAARLLEDIEPLLQRSNGSASS